jgi:hypothetical protein
VERTKRKAVSKEASSTGKKNREAAPGVNLVFKADIPRSVLARLLDMAGKPTDLSPRLLMGNPSELYPFQLAELYASNFIELPEGSNFKLTPTFLEIASVLLNPKTNLTFRIWGDLNICAETNVQFPGHIVDGGGVILNQVGTRYQISAFVDQSDIFKLIWPLIPPDSEQEINFDFEGHFELPIIAVLFGFIDLARRKAKSGVAQAGDDIMTSSLQQVNDYLSNQWGLTGFEDFITYIAVAGTKYNPPSLSQILESLITLTDVKVLIKETGDNYTLPPVFVPLVTRTIGDQAGFQWQRFTQLPSGELLWSHRIFIITDSSIIIQFAPTVGGKIFVSKVTPKQITDFLTEEVTLPPLIVSLKPMVPEPSGAQPTPSPTIREPTTPATPLTNMESIEQIDTRCRFCGRDNASGARTCKFCGQPLSKVKIRMSVPSGSQSSLPAAVSAISTEKLANTQQQLLALQQEMKSHKLELSKLEVRYKVGEMSLDQYQESVTALQSKIKKLENTLESLANQI